MGIGARLHNRLRRELHAAGLQQIKRQGSSDVPAAPRTQARPFSPNDHWHLYKRSCTADDALLRTNARKYYIATFKPRKYSQQGSRTGRPRAKVKAQARVTTTCRRNSLLRNSILRRVRSLTAVQSFGFRPVMGCNDALKHIKGSQRVWQSFHEYGIFCLGCNERSTNSAKEVLSTKFRGRGDKEGHRAFYGFKCKRSAMCFRQNWEHASNDAVCNSVQSRKSAYVQIPRGISSMV